MNHHQSTTTHPNLDQHKPIRVLFLCIGNSIRSQLAEAIMNDLSQGKFKAYSAGSHPIGFVDNAVIKQLQAMNISTNNLYSKSIEECLWTIEDTVFVDYIVSVCDAKVKSLCPLVYPSEKLSKAIDINWQVPDPGRFLDDEGHYDLKPLTAKLMIAITQMMQINLENSSAQDNLDVKKKLNDLSQIFNPNA